MAPKAEFLVLNKQRVHAVSKRDIQAFLRRAVLDLGIEKREFSVVFINDAAMREYNRSYRGFDKATDVLSFRGEDGYLGDILISSETAYNQARRSRTLSFETNLHRLMLHGLLHLMGYDHETDDGEMRTLERRYRRRFSC
jgi:probable rRNA maturation factor